jgi:hypothetical protein
MLVKVSDSRKRTKLMNRVVSTGRALARSESLQWGIALTLLLVFMASPMAAQFSGGTTTVDPTVGAQGIVKNIVDGVLYIVAAASVICFFFGCFRLFGGRVLEGILEIGMGESNCAIP